VTKSTPGGLVLAARVEHLPEALGPAAATVLDGQGRHDMYLALAGALLDRGVAPEELAALLQRVAERAGDDRLDDRVAAATSTVARRAPARSTPASARYRSAGPRSRGRSTQRCRQRPRTLCAARSLS
jgi:hypothetical protein